MSDKDLRRKLIKAQLDGYTTVHIYCAYCRCVIMNSGIQWMIDNLDSIKFEHKKCSDSGAIYVKFTNLAGHMLP